MSTSRRASRRTWRTSSELERLEPDGSCPTTATPRRSPGGIRDEPDRGDRAVHRGRSPGCRRNPSWGSSLRELMAEAIEAGWINYFTPYEEVHRENVATVPGRHDERADQCLRAADRPRTITSPGRGVEAIVYADFGCPYCAAGWARLRELPLRLCFRHFPMASKHPRAPALHAAAEAAGRQGAFWEMCDSLYADRGRVDDPHLWERAERFGLDLERFQLRPPLRCGPRAGRAGFRQRHPRRRRPGLPRRSSTACRLAVTLVEALRGLTTASGR